MSSGPSALNAMPMLPVAIDGWPSISAAVRRKPANGCGAIHGVVAAGVVEHDGEFLAAQPPDQIGRRRAWRGAISAKICSTRSPTAWPKRSLIDLKWSRSISSTAVGCGHRPVRFASPHVLEEARGGWRCRSADRSARGLVAQLGALLGHGEQDEGDRDGEQQRLEAQHLSQALSNTLAGDDGSIAPSGVRSRNSAPCANSMKIAGQRETSASSRPRQNS